MNLLTKYLVVSFAVFLGGCTVGQSDFNCSSGDDNALCGSTRSIYKATNGELDENTKITYIVDGEVHQTDVDSIDELKGKLKNPDRKNSGKNSDSKNAETRFRTNQNQFFFDHVQRNMTVSVGDVMRTKAKVMTVGINSWVDQEELFHLASIILVDIEGRLWNVNKSKFESEDELVVPHKEPLLKASGSKSPISSAK